MSKAQITFRASDGSEQTVSSDNPLPVTGGTGGGGAGDASAANQATQITAADLTNTRLTTISGQIPASLGIKTAAASMSITPASDASFTAAGDTAHDAVDAGNPIKFGGRAMAAAPTAVADNDRVNAWFTTNGALNIRLTRTDGAAFAQIETAANAQTQAAGIVANAHLQGHNGSTWDLMKGDLNGLVVQPALSSTFWNYAAASGGITNTTTAVTIKAAAGASVRNYCKSIQLSADTLGAATEIAIRDGAGGTVLWRGKLQTAGITGATELSFDPPLKGTANTLMEVVTLTATVTGGVYVNAQGYTGA